MYAYFGNVCAMLGVALIATALFSSRMDPRRNFRSYYRFYGSFISVRAFVFRVGRKMNLDYYFTALGLIIAISPLDVFGARRGWWPK